MLIKYSLIHAYSRLYKRNIPRKRIICPLPCHPRPTYIVFRLIFQIRQSVLVSRLELTYDLLRRSDNFTSLAHLSSPLSESVQIPILSPLFLEMRWFSTSEAVQRSGTPCAAQLFDLFKYMAGDNSDADFGQGEAAEGEENEVLPDFLPQDDRSSPATWDDRPYALPDDSHPHIASQETRPSAPSRTRPSTPSRTRPSTPLRAEREKRTPTYLEEAERVTERERNSLSARMTG